MLLGRLSEQAATSRTTEEKGGHTGFWEPVKMFQTLLCVCACGMWSVHVRTCSLVQVHVKSRHLTVHVFMPSVLLFLRQGFSLKEELAVRPASQQALGIPLSQSPSAGLQMCYFVGAGVPNSASTVPTKPSPQLKGLRFLTCTLKLGPIITCCP